MPGLKSSMLTRRTLAVVPVTNDNPLDAVLLVVTCNIGNRAVLAVEGVLDFVGLAVLSVDSTNQHVVGDVVQVSTVLQPWSGHGDVVGSGLSLALDQDREILEVVAVPWLKGLEKLETVRGRGDSNGDGTAISRRCLVCVLARIISVRWQTLARGLLEFELLAARVGKFVDEGIEREGASDGKSHNEIGGGDKGVSCGVGVVASSKVAVV